jgi:hypothetical protein
MGLETLLIGAGLGMGAAAATGAFTKSSKMDIPPIPKIDPKPTTVSEGFKADQRRRLARYQGRRSTILTGGLGSLGDLQVQKKTTLGD